jgi:acetyltransferase EpsM
LARLGEGVAVFPQVFVSTNAQIGDCSVVNVASTVSHDVTIGPYTVVSPGVHLAGNVRLAEECFIGMGANIIQGCSIGACAIIGAGAVVIGDIEAHTTAVGIPARTIKRGREQ